MVLYIIRYSFMEASQEVIMVARTLLKGLECFQRTPLACYVCVGRSLQLVCVNAVTQHLRLCLLIAVRGLSSRRPRAATNRRWGPVNMLIIWRVSQQKSALQCRDPHPNPGPQLNSQCCWCCLCGCSVVRKELSAPQALVTNFDGRSLCQKLIGFNDNSKCWAAFSRKMKMPVWVKCVRCEPWGVCLFVYAYVCLCV